jgi:hypothetical protein
MAYFDSIPIFKTTLDRGKFDCKLLNTGAKAMA